MIDKGEKKLRVNIKCVFLYLNYSQVERDCPLYIRPKGHNQDNRQEFSKGQFSF